MNLIDFALRGDHITLEALLKATGIAGGGGAKALIGAGAVSVNDAVDARRGRKVRAGDRVVAGETRVDVRAGLPEVPKDAPAMLEGREAAEVPEMPAAPTGP